MACRTTFSIAFSAISAAQDLFLEPAKTSPIAFPLAAAPNCTQGDQHGWPVFDDQASLQASNWAGYFQEVYGEVPQTGYPICVYSFWWLYEDVKQNHDCTEHGNSPNECPSQEGDYYKRNNDFYLAIENSAWIYHASPYSGIAENTWAEVAHTQEVTAGGEGHGIWFFYTKGSGIWCWIGKTMVFDTHPQALSALCPGNIPSWRVWTDFDLPIRCAKDSGLDLNSIQFIQHYDPYNAPCSHWYAPRPRNIEIVGLTGANGEELRGTNPCGNDSGQGVFKAGWEASQDCSCDISLDRTNCRISPGFPPNY